MDELLLKEEQPTTTYVSYPDRQREEMVRENWPIADTRAEAGQESAFHPDLQSSDLQDQKTSTAVLAEAQPGPLFREQELQTFRARWEEVQGSFVDEPRRAVELADGLVANVVDRIAEEFAAERSQLEQQWDKGNDASTEDLRQALKRYRTFFGRLLSF
jgi:hypothetical protein